MKRQAVHQQLSLFPDDNPEASEALRQETGIAEYDHTELFARLSQSRFRCSFHLSQKDKDYISAKGLPAIRDHASEFIARRLAPAIIPNDGRQTPMRGHPVFRAQHATGCCCRGCLAKWHNIAPGKTLTEAEQRYVVSVIMAWIRKEYQ